MTGDPADVAEQALILAGNLLIVVGMVAFGRWLWRNRKTTP